METAESSLSSRDDLCWVAAVRDAPTPACSALQDSYGWCRLVLLTPITLLQHGKVQLVEGSSFGG